MNHDIYSLTDIRYIHRVIIGNTDPQRQPDEEEHRRQLMLLNRCLNEAPKGRIIGQEKNFYLLNIGEHQVVMQYLVYHLGFTRKPVWLKPDETGG